MSEQQTQRRLAAILTADVVGYSKLMAADEAGTLAALHEHRRSLFDPETARYGGRIVKLMGDGTLVEFPSVVAAVECALAIQQALATSDSPIRLRIGINLGDIIIEGDDIYGDGVNVAARLEALADPGGICISSVVHESLGNRIDASFVDGGAHEVRNIARPIRVWHWPGQGELPSPSSDVKAVSGASNSRLNIAVADFTALSDDAETTHFARGFGRRLIAELGKFTVYRVLDDASARDKSDYVVEGTIRLAGNRIRVSGQVRDSHTGEHVWSGKHDGDAGDLFEFEDEAAHRLSGQIHQPLMKHATNHARALPVGERKAIDHYLCAFQDIEHPSHRSVQDAYQSCQRALELDASFTLVYESLAWVHIHSSLNAWAGDPLDTLETAREAAAAGIRHDDKEAYLRSAYGFIQVLLGDIASGLREARLAVEINPNDGEHHAFLAAAMTLAGQHEEALATFDKADRLTPDYIPSVLFRGYALSALGRHGEAAECFEQVHVAIPEFVWCLAHLAVCRQRLGEHDKARRAVATIVAQNPAMSVSYMDRLMTHREAALREAFLADLREAGLPE